jgi:hypothetical protein
MSKKKPQKTPEEMDEAANSPIYSQNAFTRTEMIIHPIISMTIAHFLKKAYIAVFFVFMENLQPNNFEKMMAFGAKDELYNKVLTKYTDACIYMMCLGQIVLLKQFVYFVYGMLNGLEALSPIDDFWLYDSQVNPINVPSFIVFDKPDVDPQEFVRRMEVNLGKDHRCGVKLVKFWGKYFF